MLFARDGVQSRRHDPGHKRQGRRAALGLSLAPRHTCGGRQMINCWCRILCLSAIAGNVCSPIALASEAPESKSTRASFDVPDGSPQSLLEFIRATKARFVEGKTRDER